MRRACSVLFMGVALLFVGDVRSADTPKEKAAAKAALQELNEFIGPWKVTGSPNHRVSPTRTSVALTRPITSPG